MAGISLVHERDAIRIYRTISYRDEFNNPQNIRKSIGNFDPITKKAKFNKLFLDLLAEQNIETPILDQTTLHDMPNYINFELIDSYLYKKLAYKLKTKDDKANEGIKKELNLEKDLIYEDINNHLDSLTCSFLVNSHKYDFNVTKFSSKIIGPHLILEKIVEDTSLLPILQKIFPEQWEKILTFAYYLVINNDSAMGLQSWAEENVTYLNKLNMQSQRVSELLSNITYSQIMNFYDEWSEIRTESEYLALDITSISSYSNLINAVEYGYNRDGEQLEQVNICLLFGEESALPIYSSLYSGSTNDVVLLRNFLDKLGSFNKKFYNLVMDKGFYSLKNIRYLINNFPNYKFLLAVPFTTDFAKNIVKKGTSLFDSKDIFSHSDEILQAVSIEKNLNDKQKIIYHVFYNEDKHRDSIRCLVEKTLRLQRSLIEDPDTFINDNEVKKYLFFNSKIPIKDQKIRLNFDRIEYEARNKGWLIIAGNDLTLDYKDAIKIYRNKNIVEKAFNNIKNNLYFNRTSVHSDNNLESKLFITTISLIIFSKIHKIMKKTKLSDKYTEKELLQVLKKIKININNTTKHLQPCTKEAINILKSFGIRMVI